MTSVRFYTLVYFALLGLATAKVVFYYGELWEIINYQMALGLTVVTAGMKTALIAGYYQHLTDEPRAISYLMLMGLFAVLLLAFAAGFSVL